MTQRLTLELERFEQLLAEQGADLERWPEPLRAAARDLLARSSAAQHAMSRAEQLAVLLDAAPDVLPSAELCARIAALPVRHPQGWAAWWPFGNPLAPLLAWGAAAAFGLFIGSGALPGLDPWVDASDSVAGGSVASGSVANGSVAGDTVAADTASNGSGTDEVQADDWSELELALGLGADWEDEP
jgi:hypothetical protein